MTNFSRILMSAAGVATIALSASPAAAQPAPYGAYNQGYNSGGGAIGAVINSVLGGGRYGAYGQGNDRMAVDQCARAAEARVSRDYRTSGYGNYPQGYNDPRYPNPGYANNGATMARVVGITNVERRSTGLKISGVIDSGRNHRYGYNSQGYDPRYSGQGYDPRYGGQRYDPRYVNQNYPNQAYGNPGYGYNAQAADLRFSCRVDFRGYVTSLDIKRNDGRRG